MFDNLPGARGQRPGDPASSKAVGFPIGHIPLRHIVKPPARWRMELGAVPRPAESFDKILAIVRNPYEQQVSQYLFWLKRGEVNRAQGVQMHPHDEGAFRCYDQMMGNVHAGFRLWLRIPRFCDFFLWYEAHHAPTEDWTPGGQVGGGYEGFGGYYRYWVSVGDRVPPNVEILRMEELATEWPRVMAEFIPDPPPLPVVNVHNPGVDWRSFYDEDAARRVESKFRWAFENFYDAGIWAPT